MEELGALQRYEFDTRGYLLIEDALPPASVATIRAAIDEQGLAPASDTIESQRFGWHGTMLGWHQALRDLIDHPLAVAALSTFIGPDARLDHAYGIAMQPGTSGLGLHGPAWPFDPAQYYLHRAGAIRSGLLAFSWSLAGGGPGDGGFGCIPGSHRSAEPVPPGAGKLVREVPQPPGSLLVFTEALVHCTLRWNGPETRLALLYKYSPGCSSWMSTPAAPPEVTRLMTKRQRLLLQPPFVGGRTPALGG
ncbi:MAG: phytanoyl-CoA dioxygenase family protein [Acidimicrobiales bacterium]